MVSMKAQTLNNRAFENLGTTTMGGRFQDALMPRRSLDQGLPYR